MCKMTDERLAQWCNIAHLVCENNKSSTYLVVFVSQHSAILKWPTPECEMVAYR